jgi:hypothetical protein
MADVDSLHRRVQFARTLRRGGGEWREKYYDAGREEES